MGRGGAVQEKKRKGKNTKKLEEQRKEGVSKIGWLGE